MSGSKENKTESDGSTTDEASKRKREEDIFGKSKRVQRTPERYKQKEDTFKKILETLSTLSEDIKEIKNNQESFSKEILELKKENESLRKQNVELKKEISIISEKVEKMEREKRRNNVVVQGLQIETSEPRKLKETMENFIKEELDIEISIKSARKLGNRTCLVELSNDEEKLKVMQNKSKLKGIQTDKIFINDDMSKNEREVQAKIRNIAKMEKAKGKKVKIGYQKIEIDKQKWVWSKEKGELEELKIETNIKKRGEDTKN